MDREIICTECPNGCLVRVRFNGEQIESVEGNLCPRGKKYAENECVDPRRIVTSTVRTEAGGLVPVKTAAPVPKRNIGAVMAKINALTVKTPVRVGDVLLENIDGDIPLVATGNSYE